MEEFSMKKAIISDIHSNLEALTAVLEDIKSKGITKIYCLGDVVGYGANPKEVIEIARKFDLTLKGNHDLAMKVGKTYGDSYYTVESTEWTRKRLLGAFKNKGELNFLDSLPEEKLEDKILYVHGSPRNSLNEYIDNEATARVIFWEYMHVPDYCFTGHTHIPKIFKYKDGKISTITPSEEPIALEPKTIINVGSVGQPRDNDSRACWISLNDNTVQYHRVSYDYSKTQDKIITAGLPEYLATRLKEGK
jgi:predicted phosphodiesterase